MKCDACKEDCERTRHHVLSVDGVALRLQPRFCGECSDAYLFVLGTFIGDLMKRGRAAFKPAGRQS